MSAYADRLFDAYRRAAKAGQDVMDAAAAENRDLTPEEAETRDRAFADVTRLKGEIDNIAKFEELAAAADGVREAAAPLVAEARAERRDPNDYELFRRGFEAVRSGSGFSFNSRITGQAYDAEFATRALSGNVGTAFNSSFADFVVVYERTMSPMLRPDIVTVLNRNTGEPFIIPRVTADPAHGGTVTAEAAGINELDLTNSQVTITPYKYGITNLWSAELDQDNTIDLVNLMARTTGRELGLDIGAALTTGDGTGDPNGFITAASNGGTATGTSATLGTYFGPADLIDLYYGRAEPYRRVGSWMANATTIAQIRKSSDDNHQLLWQAALALGQPETVLGRPIYENPAMASGSAAKAIAFGDFSQFYVIRVNPTRVDLSRDYKFSTDQLALRTIERVGGDLPDTTAIAYLVNAAV